MYRTDWLVCKDKRKWDPSHLLRNDVKLPEAVYWRCEFDVAAEDIPDAVLRICGLGYYVAYLNGKRIGDMVLEPCQTDYDKSVYFRDLEVAGLLRLGRNCLGVVLAGGFYLATVPTIWHSELMPWQGFCKLRLELRSAKGEVLVNTTPDKWRATSNGPITFSQVRSGEWYDARKEMPHWNEVGFDDSAWSIPSPGGTPRGILRKCDFPPCRVVGLIPPVSRKKVVSPDGGPAELFDFGRTLSGVCKLRVTGQAGAVVTLKYGDILDANGDFTQDNVKNLVYGDFQTDRYTLKGSGEAEERAAEFVWHGFRHVLATVEGDAVLENVDACEIHTDFERAGEFSSSSDTLNKLAFNNENAFLANFVGVPTDCPHREKQCWSGDALIAMTSGMYSFDAARNYAGFLDSFVEQQAPCGSVPRVLHSNRASCHSFEWGGPAWDGAFILMPYYLYLFTGDNSRLKRDFDAYLKLIDHYICNACEPDTMLVPVGLPDWCPPAEAPETPTKLISSAYFYAMIATAEKIANVIERPKDVTRLAQLAAKIKTSFNLEFYRGDGIYGTGTVTSLACPLYFGLAPDRPTRDAVTGQLVSVVRANRHRAFFGIQGAFTACRALGEAGYADDLYRILTQPEYPGWTDQLNRGATSFWEQWDGRQSHMHVMYGDLLACMYRFFAGIAPDEGAPGFERTIFRPLCPKELDFARAYHVSPHGRVESAWKRKPNGIEFDITVPEGASGVFEYGDIHAEVPSGTHHFTFKHRD